MTGRKLRNRLAGAASLGVIAVTVTMTLGAGAAFAAPGDPAGGATPVAPHFYNGNVETIRSAGSDTTFFLMQRISDLYTGAGLYGCTLNSASGQTLYNSSDPASSASNEEYFCDAGANTDTSDVNDNWSRTEVSTGVDDVGSGAGQEQLCGNLPSPWTVDFARSSKPIISVASGGCSTEVETGYGKDGVPAVDFTTLIPATYGTSSFSAYAGINGGNVGPVADGWLPGDPTSGPYNGTALTNISNADNGGGATSTAYRIWCASGATQISDWGQLTNLGPNLEIVDATTSASTTMSITAGAPEGTTFPASIVGGDTVSGPGIQSGTTVVSNNGSTLTISPAATASSTTATLTFGIGSALAEGQGIAIGVPIRVMGVNTASGTESTFADFAEAGVSGGGCSSNLNGNAANDPNSATAPSPNSAHVALENNGAQIAQFAADDFPSDPVDQAIEISTTLYFESNGVYNTTPYATESGVTSGGTTTLYTMSKIHENGIAPTTATLLSNNYPTARTLFNIYRSDTVRASTAGFLNWICDDNADFQKGTDNETGKNFDAEVNTLITGTFGFVRLDDNSAAPAIATPADNQAAPNTTCASGTVVVSGVTEGNGIPPVTAVSGSGSQT
jgi:hypothetical protein